VAIDADKLVKLVSGAGRLVGVKELLRVGGYNPGLKTELKRVLRDLVKAGKLERDGKRFGLKGEKHEQRSGPAWSGKRPAKPAEAVLATAPGRRSESAAAPSRSAGPSKRRPAPAPVRVSERAPTRGRTFSKRTPPTPQRPARAPRDEAPPRKGPSKTRSTHGELVEGIIHHHPDGFAFVKPIVGQVSEDLFIPPDEARKALDHDQVLVEVLPGRGGRTMGRIVEVKSRTRQLVVGTYLEKGARRLRQAARGRAGAHSSAPHAAGPPWRPGARAPGHRRGAVRRSRPPHRRGLGLAGCRGRPFGRGAVDCLRARLSRRVPPRGDGRGR
jgi:ribonuclease R